MTTESSFERRKAAAVAGHTANSATARGAITDIDAAVRIAGLRSLARLGELTDAELRVALADPEASVRIAALELAAVCPEPPIEHLLDDEDAMVVESAAWALGERVKGPPERMTAIIDRLIDVAGGHDDALAREAAVAALGAIGDEQGLDAVLAATHDKPAVRRRAVIALVAFEGPRVDAAWARARTDHDRQVRDAVDELLGPIDQPD